MHFFSHFPKYKIIITTQKNILDKKYILFQSLKHYGIAQITKNGNNERSYVNGHYTKQ